MEENKPRLNLSDMLGAYRREREELKWEGTFHEYFELVSQNPRIAQLSHARVCDMILSAGFEKVNEGTLEEINRYHFFSEELFGIEEADRRRSSSISNRPRNVWKCANESCC